MLLTKLNGLIRSILKTLFRRRNGNSVHRSPFLIKLHGFDVLINPGNPYPSIVKDTPLFNAPLVQLVHQMAAKKGAALTLIDVGASIGDTVLLLKERCPGAINRFLCVEGEDTFFALLRENTKSFKEVTLVKALLAAKVTPMRSLVKTHPGTASAMGDEWVDAVPLDTLGAVVGQGVDIIKIDVDGLDGEVLAGATQTLRRFQPSVIFEWHPKLILSTRCDPLRAFEALAASDYERLLWYNNVGTFSHFSGVTDIDAVRKMIDLLLAVNHRRDEHFDIIALHRASEIDEVKLATLNYAWNWQR